MNIFRNKIISLAGGLFVIAGSLYAFRGDLFQPCQKPIPYSIKEIDPQFNLSKTNLIKALNQAELIWETPIEKDLFSLVDNGRLKISLIYDERQDSTLKLQALGLTIKNDQNTYDTLKERYSTLLLEYNEAKTNLNKLLSGYETARALYEKRVSDWNKKGGAPPTEYNALTIERNRLNGLIAQINLAQDNLNTLIDTLNSLVNTLNRLAVTLDIQVGRYNTIGLEQGEEFQVGVYKKDSSGEEIIIYQYNDYTKLVRVLAHEMGHALGFGHSENINDIMYSVNQGDNLQLAPAEVSNLKNFCHIGY